MHNDQRKRFDVRVRAGEVILTRYQEECASLEALGEPAITRGAALELICDVLCALRASGAHGILRLLDEIETCYQEEVRNHVASTR